MGNPLKRFTTSRFFAEASKARLLLGASTATLLVYRLVFIIRQDAFIQERIAGYKSLAKQIPEYSRVYYIYDGKTSSERTSEYLRQFLKNPVLEIFSSKDHIDFGMYWHLHMHAMANRDVYLSNAFGNFMLTRGPHAPDIWRPFFYARMPAGFRKAREHLKSCSYSFIIADTHIPRTVTSKYVISSVSCDDGSCLYRVVCKH